MAKCKSCEEKAKKAAEALKKKKMIGRAKNQHQMYGEDMKWKGTGHIKAAFDKKVHFMKEGGAVVKKKMCGGDVAKYSGGGFISKLFGGGNKPKASSDLLGQGMAGKAGKAMEQAKKTKQGRLDDIMRQMGQTRGYSKGGQVGSSDHYGSYGGAGGSSPHKNIVTKTKLKRS